MSAECEKCGTDLVGTQWDDDGLTCPVCERDERIDDDTELLEACREALHGVLFYVDEMAQRVLGQPKEMLPDKRLAAARSSIKQLDKRLKER